MGSHSCKDPLCIAESDEPYCIYNVGAGTESVNVVVPAGVGTALSESTGVPAAVKKSFLVAQRTLPKVRGCGHELDLRRQPRHGNCKPCWTAFFRNQEGLAESLAKIVVEQGEDRVIEAFGKKFLKRFHEYCILATQMEALRQAYVEETKDVN